MNDELKLYKDIVAMIDQKFNKLENKLEIGLEKIYNKFNEPVKMNTFFRKVFILAFTFIVPIVVTLLFKLYS